MKYISNRNEFLKNHKLKNNNELETNKILEGIGYTYGPDNAGPFSNSIPWGDSLLGRMIHNIIRKARIGIGMVGIKREIERLKSAFDSILDSSIVSKLDEGYEKEYNKIIIFSFVDNLKRAIENKEDILIIKNLTKECINTINNYKEFDKKEYLIKQLKEFLKFLEGLEEVKKGDKGESDNIYYQACIALLKSVSELAQLIENKKLGQESEDNRIEKEIEKEKANVAEKEKANTITQNSNYFYRNESLPIFENTATASIINSDLYTVKNSLKKITTSFDNSGLNKVIYEIRDIIKKAESGDEVSKKYIKNIGKQVVRNELTFGKSISFEDLIKEGLYDNDIPKAVSLFGKTLLAFKQSNIMNKDLISKLGNVSKPIKNFISAYDKIKQLNSKQEENKEDIKKESLLLNYYDFIVEKDDININSAEEISNAVEKDDSIKDPVNMTRSQKIKDYWDKNMDIKSFVMERTEVEKIKNNIDKIKEDDNIIIDGIDPIIEIVKCFNRAYKLHTTQVIPTGRNSGIVTNKIFREYTCFGNGTPDSAGHSGGPYRNNAIFNQWENAVLNIKGDKKYQKLFRGETILKTEEGKEIKNAGKNLAKFMLDLLNGEDLYKSGSGSSSGVTGKQQEFIEKYFNCKPTKEDNIYREVSIVQDLSKNIKDINLKFSKTPLKFEKYNELINTFFTASTIDEKGEYRQIYFYIQDIDDKYFYLSYCASFYFFLKYITESGIALKAGIGKGDLNANIKLNPIEKESQYQIKATKIDITKLIINNGNFLLNSRKTIKYITKFNSGKNEANIKAVLSDKEDIFNIQSVYTLVKEEKKDEENAEITRFKADKIKEDIIRKNGGFPKIKISNDIMECEIK